MSVNLQSKINKIKLASYLIRLRSKGLGKDVTMPLGNAKKMSHVTNNLDNLFAFAASSRVMGWNTYDFLYTVICIIPRVSITNTN